MLEKGFAILVKQATVSHFELNLHQHFSASNHSFLSNPLDQKSPSSLISDAYQSRQRCLLQEEVSVLVILRTLDNLLEKTASISQTRKVWDRWLRQLMAKRFSTQAKESLKINKILSQPVVCITYPSPIQRPCCLT
jgi:hypothetical protein